MLDHEVVVAEPVFRWNGLRGARGRAQKAVGLIALAADVLDARDEGLRIAPIGGDAMLGGQSGGMRLQLLLREQLEVRSWRC